MGERLEPLVETKKGKRKIVDGGCGFVFDKPSRDGDTSFWRCEMKTQQEPCNVSRVNHDVSHSQTKLEVQAVKTQMKRRAADTQETTAQIIANSIGGTRTLPIADLDTKLDELAAILPAELQVVLSYFEDTYVGRPLRGRNGRRQALFAPEVWSVYNRTLTSDPRTNNHAEASHRRLQCEMLVDHPTIWRFINGLRKVQKGREMFHEGLIRGDAPPAKLPRYVQNDTRILNIVTNYETKTTEEYLRGLAHNNVMNP